ncbi:protein O-linked-mannose beta-1,4-N-acetylglucosaminyltransferase 2 [Senna tora]|uniref:Protein O-linked-mannose beta-1,4-N-acetylglucosaminyltransferase 2 n=1 Tax=Senna tora TaxID=362788 RepID=A0A834WM28_9FABA|nr:protein O-linked-mannose beta-1,4-N-acetylglucosaminyltransferase 2 [Senna tora]
MKGSENMVMMKMKGVSSSTMVALLFFCSILIAAHMTLSPSSSSSSSTSIISLISSSPLHSELENPRGEIRKEMKQDQVQSQPSKSPITTQITCDRTSPRYDLCSINGPTAVDPTTATFFVMGPKRTTKPIIVEKIKPYPRKFEGPVMAEIKNVTLVSGPQSPPCKVHHNVPALVFSVGGYTGNFYHDFNDGFFPLFITVNTILRDQDFVIVISEGPDWWSTKYKDFLLMFSKHPIVTLENDTSTHCFPWAHLGLITHGFMTLNQTLLSNSKSYLHFRHILHEAYGYQNQTLAPKKPISRRPRLVLASRNGTTGRALMNEKEAIQVMEEVGFDVAVFEPNDNTSLHESYALINSSEALIGVHGAALTHSLFLRPGAVFLQIVPIGTEWAANAFFGSVAKGLNLEYIEYRIKVNESSLVEEYGKDNLMLKNPFALQKNGWPTEIMDIYLKKQNVKLDLVRFKEYVKEAYKKANKFMHKENNIN